MDNINIEIESSSDKASKGINQLVNTLGTLNNTLGNSSKNINKYVNNNSQIALLKKQKPSDPIKNAWFFNKKRKRERNGYSPKRSLFIS